MCQKIIRQKGTTSLKAGIMMSIKAGNRKSIRAGNRRSLRLRSRFKEETWWLWLPRLGKPSSRISRTAIS